MSFRCRWSLGILFAGFIAAFLYTFVLAIDEGMLGDWLTLAQPVTDAIGRIVPAPRLVAADLVRRGFPARAVFVGHVVAFQWLICALYSIGAGALVCADGGRLRRHFAAQRETTSSGPTDRTWRKTAAGILFGILFLYAPFHPRINW